MKGTEHCKSKEVKKFKDGSSNLLIFQFIHCLVFSNQVQQKGFIKIQYVHLRTVYIWYPHHSVSRNNYKGLESRKAGTFLVEGEKRKPPHPFENSLKMIMIDPPPPREITYTMLRTIKLV